MTIFHLINQTITFHPMIIIVTAILYILFSLRLSHQPNIILWLSYLPTLLHEFGHVIFCVVTGGKVKDIVIVARASERIQTARYGYAVTETHHRFNQLMTTIGGYIFPPVMMIIGILALDYKKTMIFWLLLLVIFSYYCVKTSRKLLPVIVIIIISCIIYYSGIHPGAEQYTGILYHLIIGILLADTLLVIRTITLVYFKGHSTNWDGAVLSRLTRLPVFFYYLLFVLFNLTASYWVITFLLAHF